jgi:AcrR family transcriptional regulator
MVIGFGGAMPTPFSDRQRATIRAALMDAGRRHFAARGLSKTPLTDLTDAAGVAKSTFYAFFDSKEALCLALIAEMGPEVEAVVLAPTRDAALAPHQAIVEVVRALRRVYATRPLLRRLLTHPDDLRAIAARVGPDELAAKARALAPLQAFVAAARDDGRVRADVDPAVAVAALQGILLLELHADRLAPHHDAVIELLTEALGRRLAGEGRP